MTSIKKARDMYGKIDKQGYVWGANGNRHNTQAPTIDYNNLDADKKIVYMKLKRLEEKQFLGKDFDLKELEDLRKQVFEWDFEDE